MPKLDIGRRPLSVPVAQQIKAGEPPNFTKLQGALEEDIAHARRLKKELAENPEPRKLPAKDIRAAGNVLEQLQQGKSPNHNALERLIELGEKAQRELQQHIKLKSKLEKELRDHTRTLKEALLSPAYIMLFSKLPKLIDKIFALDPGRLGTVLYMQDLSSYGDQQGQRLIYTHRAGAGPVTCTDQKTLAPALLKFINNPRLWKHTKNSHDHLATNLARLLIATKLNPAQADMAEALDSAAKALIAQSNEYKAMIFHTIGRKFRELFPDTDRFTIYHSIGSKKGRPTI